MRKDSGGSAFPQVNIKDYQGMLIPDLQKGMTLRDYFAAKAMQGMIANKGWFGGNNPFGKGWDSVEAMTADYAKEAYAFADAMIKARDEL